MIVDLALVGFGNVAVTQPTGGLTQTAFGVVADLIAIRRRLPA